MQPDGTIEEGGEDEAVSGDQGLTSESPRTYGFQAHTDDGVIDNPADSADDQTDSHAQADEPGDLVVATPDVRSVIVEPATEPIEQGSVEQGTSGPQTLAPVNTEQPWPEDGEAADLSVDEVRPAVVVERPLFSWEIEPDQPQAEEQPAGTTPSGSDDLQPFQSESAALAAAEPIHVEAAEQQTQMHAFEPTDSMGSIAHHEPVILSDPEPLPVAAPATEITPGGSRTEQMEWSFGLPRRSTSAIAPSRAKRSRMTVKRVDPWSVLKFSIAFYTATALVGLLLFMVIFFFASSLDIVKNIETFIRTVGWPGFRLRAFGVFKIGIGLGFITVIFWSTVNLFLAFLYNLVADVVGGIQVTTNERDI